MIVLLVTGEKRHPFKHIKRPTWPMMAGVEIRLKKKHDKTWTRSKRRHVSDWAWSDGS